MLLRNLTATVGDQHRRLEAPPPREPSASEDRAPVAPPRHINCRSVITPPPPPIVEDYVSGLVLNVQRTPEQRRLAEHAEEGSYLHLSNLIDLCPRQVQLAEGSHNLSVAVSRVDANMRIIWAMGRAAENEVRASFIEGHGAENVFAMWECRCGGMVYGPRTFDPDAVCNRCHGLGEHREVPIPDEEYRIVGNADLVYLNARRFFEVVEIKSIKRDDFERLNGPVRRHVLQASGYHRLYERGGFPVEPRVRILYVCKAARAGSPYKEFLADPYEGWVSQRLDDMWETARLLAEGRRTGTLCSRICGSPSDSLARQCPVVGDCFSRSR